ncbi:D-lactate ferricytochrome c oxidoreductase [Ascosphaera pollenicola]|nr:D-lactate ferricytochrome c oxidoreductase [Ascosphaera pollenicola]
MYRHSIPSTRVLQVAAGRRAVTRAGYGLRAFSATSQSLREVGDFKGQLYESTRQRLEREREHQKRLAQGQQQSPGFKYLATTLCRTTVSQDKASSTSTLPLKDLPPRLEHDVSISNLQAAWHEFVEILGSENVSTDKPDIIAHAGSEWSSYYRKEDEKPFLVVYPSSTEEVSEVMKVCHRRKIPIVAFSGGTSLEGHYTSTRAGVCVDFHKMDKILQLHKDDLDVVVQPAVYWEDLAEQLAPHDLFFPPDPGPGAMIGGMIGTGCSGTNAYRYGTMRDWVLSLTVVLADGTVIKTKQRPRKSSAGYDLTRLFIGSEGTLGLVTEATLKLTPKPKNVSVAVASFPTIGEAAQCVSKIVAEGLELAGLEILDDVQMKCINASQSTTRQWREAPTLFLKFSGTDTSVKEQISIVQKLAKGASSKSFEFATNADEARELWSARKEALWSVLAMKRKPSDKLWTTDVAVPISKLPEIIERTKEDLTRNGLLAGICGHVGDGNFHTIILADDDQHEIAEGVVHRMVKRAVELEGTVTGEHGVGLIKRDYLPHEVGETTIDTMRKLKQALDPLLLLNPDKVIRLETPKPGEVKEW